MSRVSRAADDPLPSWNDGPAKKAILDFVHTTTDRLSSKFVPKEERIATFDQDGTLWQRQVIRFLWGSDTYVGVWTCRPISESIRQDMALDPGSPLPG